MRCARIRLITYMIRMPAFTKIEAAIARRPLCGKAAHEIRRDKVTILAIQKPNIAAEGRNLCPFRRFSWKMVMFVAAKQMYRKMKTASVGASVEIVGSPPMAAVFEGYGPPILLVVHDNGVRGLGMVCGCGVGFGG